MAVMVPEADIHVHCMCILTRVKYMYMYYIAITTSADGVMLSVGIEYCGLLASVNCWV